MKTPLDHLAQELEGDLFHDDLIRTLYATDASVYQELPLAVVYPKHEEDLKKVIRFAYEHMVSIIPRAAGTSLAGQVVGHGIVVDISKYLNRIVELNIDEAWVIVQPGVVRDELNQYLKPFGYHFGPNTSTANRAMLGGMVGNNSCGQSSIVYGSTRDHVLEIDALLSDGSEAHFMALDRDQFKEKCRQTNLEGSIYRFFDSELSNPEQQEHIRREFPDAIIRRRNTGYAVDLLMNSELFSDSAQRFDLCKLLCGSEGTLAFTTQIKLHIDPLPPPEDVVLAIHCNSINQAMRATQVAMTHQPTACELMDKIILDCTKENIGQRKNRFFIEGDPAGVLLVEFRAESQDMAIQKAQDLITEMKAAGLGYAFPIVNKSDTHKVWDLRKAGLGLLSNIPGDKKAVACIEDTAVALRDLPDYISEFTALMESFGQRSVYYAHAGDGEIHLRPILNLKDPMDRKDFYAISEKTARLVKKYKGSLSGEHGDGRLRGTFLPLMIGPDNYALLKRLKATWDPQGIFNPGKIVDVPKMNTSLRYAEGQETADPDTLLDFSTDGGFLRLAEKCNGSGDCRKLPLSGGTMCPSYQATRNEKDSTRARANALRNYLTKNDAPNPFDHQELNEVLDLCLSCKGCTSECPSNIDMASMKAEFLHQYYKSHRIPLRSRVFANYDRINRWAALLPGLTNKMLAFTPFKLIMHSVLETARQRALPQYSKISLRKWYSKHKSSLTVNDPIKVVYLFCDEFINYNESHIGIKAIQLLHKLGYQVKLIDHVESGRAAISKGLLPLAKKYAEKNVQVFKPVISEATPLIGIEPSAILSFADEYPRMVDPAYVEAAKRIATNAWIIDDFIQSEVSLGNIKPDSFTEREEHIMVHAHCHQKSLASGSSTAEILSIPKNYMVQQIPSGCCGMAGSFGYEREHYAISMQIGSMVLFPAIQNSNAIIAAPGTSCRHQIKDGTGRPALHPVEILYDALA